MNYEDIKAKFPGASSVGGEIIARVDGEMVVVANYVNGGFSLTPHGENAPEQKAPKVPKAPRNKDKASKEATAPVAPVDPVTPPVDLVDPVVPPVTEE